LKRISLLLVLLVLGIGACASPAGQSEASEPSSTPEPTAEPTAEPSVSADASMGAIPSFDLNGDPELAGRFPDTVGGQQLQVQSFRGDTFMAMGGSDPQFEAFLDSVGAELEDVSVAFGGAGIDSSSALSVGAFRILGASEDDLEREFIAASEQAGDMSNLEQTNVAGKDVWTGTDPSGQTNAAVYLYTKDDTLYFLTGTEEQVTEILEALP
jgi:hypothetical protein